MRGMGGMAGIGGLMKQAQQMQERMKKAQEELAAAVNDAVRRVEETSQGKMSGFTAGLNLPPGFKLPF